MLEIIKKSDLGFSTLTPLHPMHHAADRNIADSVANELCNIFNTCNFGVENHLDDQHFEHMSNIETKTLFKTISLNKVTEATAELLQKEKKVKGETVGFVIEDAASRKVDKHFRKVKKM